MKGIRAMPNCEKEHAKERVKAKLAEAQTSRLSQQAKELKSEGGTGQRTKTVKKPVPNFGGGKVGTK
ncbi:hypothetical protein EON65_04955 [archaeon]|nr:MAG: hypothetical protein EON65_04955 [archaeon]